MVSAPNRDKMKIKNENIVILTLPHNHSGTIACSLKICQEIVLVTLHGPSKYAMQLFGYHYMVPQNLTHNCSGTIACSLRI